MTGKDPQRILVIRRKAIGDVIVSMDVLRALRERWPDAHLTLVLDRFAAPVAKGSPFVDEVLVYERRVYAEGSVFSRIAQTRRWFRRLRGLRADLCVDLHGTPQTALWSWMSGAPLRVGPRRRFRTWAYHRHVERESRPRFAGERFLDWVRVLDIEPGPWRPHPMPRSSDTNDRCRRLARDGAKGPVVVLNASATWPAKAWPLPHFASLARTLRDSVGARVWVAWGPGEEKDRDTLLQLGEGSLRAMPPTDLPTLAAWLGAVDLLVTTDSGPKHIGVGEGTPTLTLFGSTDPQGWQPATGPHRGIHHDVPCRPCNRLECNVPGHPCLDELLPERVAVLAREMLESGASS